MAQDTQYWSFKYILGTAYSAKTEASEISPVGARTLVALVRLYLLKLVFGHRSGISVVDSRCSEKLSRTDGSRLDHVADGETLDGLVLGDAAGAVGAAHRLDVAAAILVATAIKSISYRAPEVANRLNPVSHSPCPAMCVGRGLSMYL
jgi:hypothetical protein